MGKHSSESFSVSQPKPVVSTDVNQDKQFEVLSLMNEAGVRVRASVPIFLPHERAYPLSDMRR